MPTRTSGDVRFRAAVQGTADIRVHAPMSGRRVVASAIVSAYGEWGLFVVREQFRLRAADRIIDGGVIKEDANG